MTTLVLTRHGHVPGIAPERFRGQIELELSPTGVAQAAAVAARIAGRWQPSAIYTSPLGRCVATGAQIAAATGCAAQAHPALADIHYGDWTWKTHEAAEAEHGARYAQWRAAPHRVRFPGGESLQDVAVRAADLMRHVAEAHDGQSVVLVGHDSFNRVLLIHLLDLPLSAYWSIGQDPCNLTVLEWAATGPAKLLRLNDTGHTEHLPPAPPA